MRCRRCGRRDVLMSTWWICADCVRLVFGGADPHDTAGYLLAVLAGLGPLETTHGN